MAWEKKHEIISLAEAKHLVVFHNTQILEPDYAGSGKMVPQEHHLLYDMRLWACPHCGRPHTPAMGEPVDMHAKIQEVHTTLQEHFQQMMRHREKHPHVQIGHIGKMNKR